MTAITYAGMTTREVDFDRARQELADFLKSDQFDVAE